MATPDNKTNNPMPWVVVVLMGILALGGIAWVVLVWRWIFKGMPCG